MPRVPTGLANGTERFFGHDVTVVALDRPSPGITVATLTGAVLAKARPGAEVEFRVSDQELRHFTLAGTDPDRQCATIVFHTRGDGPGRDWVRALAVGRALRMLGPSGALPDESVALVLGDATAIGFARAMPQPPPAGAIEVHEGDVAAVAELLSALDVLAARAPGEALAAWLAARTEPFDAGPIHLAGHAQTCVMLRRSLRERDMPRRRIRTHAYWADGKTGL